jgi:hypothetical protein
MKMELKNTTLDDISAVIGLSATLRLSAWFGDGAPVYIPAVAEEGQTIVKLIGMPAAKALSKMWGLEHLAIPRVSNYEGDVARQRAGRLHEMGFGANEIGQHLRLSKRRVQQMLDELRQANLLPEIAHKNARKNPGQNRLEKEAAEKAPRALPPGFFGQPDFIKLA